MTYFKILISKIIKEQKTYHLFLFIILVTGMLIPFPSAMCQNSGAAKNWFLRYEGPAQSWTEALPVGNGRMGAMVYGRVNQEKIQFNHDEIWTGQPIDYQHPGAADVLPELRRLLFQGKQREAHDLVAAIYACFPDSGESMCVKNAKALLEESL